MNLKQLVSLSISIFKPVYKGDLREPENVPFIYRSKLYTMFINEKYEVDLYRQ